MLEATCLGLEPFRNYFGSNRIRNRFPKNKNKPNEYDQVDNLRLMTLITKPRWGANNSLNSMQLTRIVMARKNAFYMSTDSGPVSIVFDEYILTYVIHDHDVLQMALVAERNSCRLLKLLFAEFKDCLLEIGGTQTADLLGVDPGSCSIPFLDLSHFSQRTVEFSLQHISNLPSWTTGTRNAKDLLVIILSLSA